VLQGDSTIDELLRVVDVPYEGEASPEERDKRPSGQSGRASRDKSRLSDAAATAAALVGEITDAPITESFELLEPIEAERKPGHGIKVLLVDDEDPLRKVLRDLLERDGYVVSEAADGVEALDQVDRVAPDIIVLDLNLPGLDGYGVLSHLRSRTATADVPVVVLTAKGDEDNEVRVFEMGADDFLSKPFRAKALSARLQAVLQRSRRVIPRQDT
jgi:CheY-like chemotaxis protein